MAVIAVSTAAIFIRIAQSEANTIAIAAWRLIFASLIISPYALKKHKNEIKSLNKKQWIYAIVSGILLAIHFLTWIKSLELTTVAVSVVLVTTNPLFVAIISHFFLGEKITKKILAGLILAFTGSIIIAISDLGQGVHRLLGDVLALTGSLSVAGYFLIGRKLRSKLSLIGYIFPVYLTAAITLLIISIITRTPMTGYTNSTWTLIFLTALIPQVLGHSSLNWALKYLKTTYVTLSVLGEPIGSSILAWIILKEIPTKTVIIGSAIVLTGIYLAKGSEVKRETKSKT